MRKICNNSSHLYYKLLLAPMLVCLISIQVMGQCDVSNSLTVPESYFNSGYSGNGNFNAIVFGSFSTSDGEIGGRLAVGGNFTNQNVSGTYDVGITATSPVSSDNLIVNGTINNPTGGTINVRGNAKYGVLNGDQPSHASGGTNSVATNQINFPGLLNHYKNLSEDLADNTANGTFTHIDGIITLIGDGSIKNYVFNVQLGVPEILGVVFDNIPNGSTIVINILNNGGINISEAEENPIQMVSTYRDVTLFNFPNATNIQINNFTFQGSVLMPNVEELAVTDGEIAGVCIIGGTVVQALRFNIINSCLSAPLPVILAKFTAQKEGNTALLNWQTTSDVNATKFVVERSQGKNKKWQAIGTRDVQASSATIKSYTYTDTSPFTKTNLYRLKMEDKDGTFSYSRLEELYFENTDGVKAYPNPATDMVSLITEGNKKIQSVTATNLTGREYPAQLVDRTSVTIKNWPAGIYLLKLTTDDGVVTTKKVIKH